MSGNLWMFSDMLDDEDIEMQKHDFITLYVPTESMEPTLETGSLILGLRIFDELETGDIIIFRRDGSHLVKRIAACAGDTIDHQNSIVTVPDNCYYVLGDNAEKSTTPGTGRIRMYLMKMSSRSC